MNITTSRIFIIALTLVALCVLFPPRRLVTGVAIGRGFLFSSELDRHNVKILNKYEKSFEIASIDAPRSASECILILSIAGVVALASNRKGKDRV